MKLENCTVEEHGGEDGHFVITEKGAEPFRMAKKAMSKSDIARARRFANGGKVQGYADGGPVVSEPITLGAADLDPGALAAPGVAAPQMFSAPSVGLTPSPIQPEGRLPTAAEMEAFKATANPLGSSGPAPLGVPTPGITAAVNKAKSVLGIGGSNPTLSAPSAAPSSTPSPQNEAAAQTKAAPMVAGEGSMSVSASSRGPVGGVPRPAGTPDLDAALKLQQQGIDNAAATAQAEATARESILRDRAAQQEAARKGFEDRMNAHRERMDGIISEIKDGKIDPNHYWASKSTGSKVANIAGMMFGALGAGLTHGPNMAIQQIDKAIEQDIDAQKSNLENKKSLFNMYLAQGADERSAHQLAKADLLDLAATKLDMVAAKYGGDKAKDAAMQAKGALGVQAFQLRQDAESKRAENALKRAQASNYYAEARAKTAKSQDKEVLAALANGHARLSPADIAAQGKDVAERAIHHDDGTFSLASGPEEAKQIRAAQSATAQVLDLTNQMRALRGKVGGFGGEVMDRGAVREGKSLTDQLRLKIKDAAKLGALSGDDNKILDSIVADPTSFQSDAAFNSAMDQVERMVKTGRRTIENANLMKPQVSGYEARTASDKSRS